MSTDLNQIDGVGPAIAQKLIDSGFRTIESIATAKVSDLASIEGISEAQAKKIIKAAINQSNGVFELKFKTGDELLAEYDKRELLSSGCTTLDNILGGGFSTQKLYELWGAEGTGKSNLLHQLICMAALPKSKGGLGARTIYIDAENSMSIKRIKEIAPRFGLDPIAVIKGVSRTVPANSDALYYMCSTALGAQIEATNARLIIVDSIATFFRSEYGHLRQTLPERQQKVNQIIHELKKYTKLYNAVTVITNQATGDPSGYGLGIKHSLGHVIGHESEVRIHISIKSASKNERKFKIDKAVDLPKDEVILKLKQDGYYDIGATSTAKKSKSDDEEEEESEEISDEIEEREEESSDESEKIPLKPKLSTKKRSNK